MKIIIFVLSSFICLSYPYQKDIGRASQKYGVDSFLVAAIIKVESNFHKNAKGSSECNGLMQIRKGPMNPVKNIFCGTGIFKHYLKKCNGDILKALGSYNRGFSGYKKYFKKHGHHSKYVLKVMKVYNQYLEIETRRVLSGVILNRFN